jgi:hypothetical protein
MEPPIPVSHVTTGTRIPWDYDAALLSLRSCCSGISPCSQLVILRRFVLVQQVFGALWQAASGAERARNRRLIEPLPGCIFRQDVVL